MKQDRTEPTHGTPDAAAAGARGPGKSPLTAGVPPDGAARSSEPGAVTLTGHLPLGVAPVQRKQSLAAALSPEATHAAAAEGVRGGGEALPFRDQIQASFGGHDVSGVRARSAADSSSSARTRASASSSRWATAPS